MKICLASITASHYRRQIYGLLDKELECDFIFGKDDSTVKRLDISCLRHSVDAPNLKVKGNWYRQKNLIKNTKDYDIIIDDLSIFCLSSWWLHFVAKLRGQKLYTWSHGWYGREGFVKKWMKRAYFALTDGSFIYGDYARKLMIENGFDGNKLHVIHNSLNYDEQLKIRKEITTSNIYISHFGNTNPVICFIGRLTSVKKLDQIVDALLLLKEKGESYNLVFVGDGSERDRLEVSVERLGLKQNVWFYGACYDEKTNAELIYNSDLCVAPGNIGLTAMHAMMFGCPCLSHKDFPWQGPEFEAIKEEETGCFFKRDNVQSLAAAISKWFYEKTSKREDVRKACFKEIDENWNPHKQLEIIKGVIAK